MFRGTKNVPNYDIPLQETGAQSNAFTSEDMTVYFETVPTSFLDRALYLEAERLAFLPSALDQEKFDTEREVVKNERRQSYENVPYGLAEETILANVFPKGHPYSWSVIGSMKDLDAASLDGPPAVLRRVLPPGQRLALPGGRLRPGRGEGVDRPSISARSPPAGRSSRSPPRPRRWRSRSTLGRTDKVSLPRLYWAWPTVADDHPDAPALHLLASVLSRRRGVAAPPGPGQGRPGRQRRRRRQRHQGGRRPVHRRRHRRRGEDARRRRRRPSTPRFADLDARAADRRPSWPGPWPSSSGRPSTSLTSPLGRAIMLAIGLRREGRPGLLPHATTPATTRSRPPTSPGWPQAYLTPEKVVLTIAPAKPGRAQERRPSRPARCPARRPRAVAEPPQTPDGPTGRRCPARPPRPAWQPPDTSGRRSPTGSTSGSSPGRPCRSSRPG